MKKLILLVIFFGFLIFNINCKKDSNIIYPINEIQTDGPTEKVDLVVLEYVKITDDALNVWYEWRQTAAYSCSDCYFDPHPHVKYDSFVTPLANRYEGSNYVQTQYFKIEYHVNFQCRASSWAGYWRVSYSSTNYLNEFYGFHNHTSQNCTPPLDNSGNYSNEINNLNLPANSTIDVAYGIEILTEKD